MRNPENKSESTPGNILIPLMLLVVSVIVIVATFYENDDQELIAQATTQTESVVDQPEDITSINQDAITGDQENTSNESLTNTTADTEQAITQDNEAIPTPIENSNEEKITSANEDKTTVPAEVIVTAQATENTSSLTESKAQNNSQASSIPQQINPASNTITRTRPVQKTPYQHKKFNSKQHQEYYNARVARAQEQARQYHEMKQQRRQSYMREMESRRLQHKAAMKAKVENKTETSEAQKAAYQQSQQERIKANQKIQKIRKQIFELHQEIHQIMNNSQSTAISTGEDQQIESETNIDKT